MADRVTKLFVFFIGSNICTEYFYCMWPHASQLTSVQQGSCLYVNIDSVLTSITHNILHFSIVGELVEVIIHIQYDIMHTHTLRTHEDYTITNLAYHFLCHGDKW